MERGQLQQSSLRQGARHGRGGARREQAQDAHGGVREAPAGRCGDPAALLAHGEQGDQQAGQGAHHAPDPLPPVPQRVAGRRLIGTRGGSREPPLILLGAPQNDSAGKSGANSGSRFHGKRDGTGEGLRWLG